MQILHQTTTNQPSGKDKFMLASFSFSPFTYSGTSYITETIPLAHKLGHGVGKKKEKKKKLQQKNHTTAMDLYAAVSIGTI